MSVGPRQGALLLWTISPAARSMVGAIPCGRYMGIKLMFAIVFSIFIMLCLAVFLAGCGSGAQQQAQQVDPRLKLFHILSSRIIILDNQAEVDGSIQNTGKDRYPFDVTVDATFYDKAGNVIGQAEGVAEDVLPGMSRAFVLIGQVDSLHYSHMELALVSLRERRKELNLPTPPPVSP
jgi:hypothetical protein